MQQKRMFETEDLPLFSGTAPTGHVEALSTLRDTSLVVLEGFTCKLCFDTGMVRVKHGVTRLCWCKVGDKLRKEATP